MKSPFDLGSHWNTRWSGAHIVVLRNDVEVDRVHAPDIRRLVFVQPTHTVQAGDLSFAVVELIDEFVVFPADTGFAGRVHFERQAFWASKACIFWADAATAQLPSRCLQRRGFALTRRAPAYVRVPHDELAGVVDRWVLEGPQSWDERRWQRIERGRPFARVDTRRADPLPAAGGSTR